MNEYFIKMHFSCSFNSKTKIRDFVRKYNKKLIPVNFMYSHWDEKYVGFDIIIKDGTASIVSLEISEFLKNFNIHDVNKNIEIGEGYSFEIDNIGNVYEVRIIAFKE